MPVLLQPATPSDVWVMVDQAGDVIYECGRCGDGWYAAADDSLLDFELACRACSLELYRRQHPASRPDSGGADVDPELWLREHGWAGDLPPYLLPVTEREWAGIADAIETGADHPADELLEHTQVALDLEPG